MGVNRLDCISSILNWPFERRGGGQNPFLSIFTCIFFGMHAILHNNRIYQVMNASMQEREKVTNYADLCNDCSLYCVVCFNCYFQADNSWTLAILNHMHHVVYHAQQIVDKGLPQMRYKTLCKYIWSNIYYILEQLNP